VLREIPNTRAICEIGIRSARRSRRISAQSSTINTHFLPGSDRARLSAQVIRFRAPRPVQFSAAVDINGQFVLPAGGQEFSPLVARYFSPTAAR
jgi:hypothetical protein